MSFSHYFKQIFNSKKILQTIVFATIPALIFYTISLLWLGKEGFSSMQILRDMAQQTDKSSFLGFLSNIGTWLWISSSAISFFAFINYRTTALLRHRELLLLIGTLSLLLGIDDFFMIHDRYLDQRLCYATYAILALALLVRHFHNIIEINAFAFLSGGGLLALSILTDLFQDNLPFGYSNVQIIEEGFKFLGAGTWLYFASLVASYREA
jgi:hypothetical protein